MSNDEIRLKIAIQKSGRLTDKTLDLLEKCGIHLVRSKDQLFCRAQNFPLDVMFVRDDDIPEFVSMNVCQLGVVGQNVLEEELALDTAGELANIEVAEELGFGKCRLCIAAPHDFAYDGPASLTGKIIATSYKGILKAFLKKQGIEAKMVSMEGAVEIAPRMKIADVICDLVSTGTTLTANGLRECEEIMRSQSVLIRNDSLTGERQVLLDRLLKRMRGTLRARDSKYIMLHAPKERLVEITKALPGAESPTILPLQGCDDKVVVHAVCEEAVFWNTMEELKNKGASAILVLPIEKMLD
ncbi:MAG: ATP phosphoribosyltransferase [Rhodospirillales bacterium]|nr:ATP phosphoribosyltransferase [Rhodospirillales bacterium]